jgi:hypothetical protein
MKSPLRLLRRWRAARDPVPPSRPNAQTAGAEGTKLWPRQWSVVIRKRDNPRLALKVEGPSLAGALDAAVAMAEQYRWSAGLP